MVSTENTGNESESRRKSEKKSAIMITTYSTMSLSRAGRVGVNIA
jgi:hypothetical protein